MAASSFPDFITSRRRELELTLGDVAAGVGVSTITVSNWSSGDTRPNPENLVALANLLDVPPGDLAAMAGVSIKSAPERAVNLMPQIDADPEAEAESDKLEADTGEIAEPVVALRGSDETPVPEVPEAEPADAEVVEPAAGESAAEVEPPAVVEPAKAATDEAEPEEPDPDQVTAAEVPIPIPEPDLSDGDPAPDPIDSELAELIEEAAAPTGEEPELVAAAVPAGGATAEPAATEPAKKKPVVKRPRRAAPAERPVTALPLTYIEDPKQLTRYRIRWALTIVVLAIMFFVLLWASRELLSALSEVKQAVTPGGIGTS